MDNFEDNLREKCALFRPLLTKNMRVKEANLGLSIFFMGLQDFYRANYERVLAS